MNLNDVKNKTAKSFLYQFFLNRKINRDFYELVSEDKMDYRMVNSSLKKSDSPKESLIHQIDTQRDYINGIKQGELKFNVIYKDLINNINLSKTDLLHKLHEEDNNLIELLSVEGISEKKLKVPWSKEPVLALEVIWGLNTHEILHTGWNLAVMDHLGIERFASLKQIWG